MPRAWHPLTASTRTARPSLSPSLTCPAGALEHTMTLTLTKFHPAITAAIACGHWSSENTTPGGLLVMRGSGGGVYPIYERLRPHGWRIVEASDNDMPYAAGLVNDEARASLTYAEGDLCLTICPTAHAWAAELRSLTAWYAAPVLASLNFNAPGWDYLAEEPRVSAELEETWLYACNDGNCYRDFMAAVRPLVRAYLRGEYTASMGAPVFAALLREAASRYRREFRCAYMLNADEVAAWSMYEADRLTLRLWEMRRTRGIGWRGVEEIMREECAALTAEKVTA